MTLWKLRISLFPDGFEIFDKGDNICFVKYSNKINGFDVRIAVRPFAYIDSILFGSAEIAFFTERHLLYIFAEFVF